VINSAVCGVHAAALLEAVWLTSSNDNKICLMPSSDEHNVSAISVCFDQKFILLICRRLVVCMTSTIE